MFKMQKNLEIVAHDQFREFISRNQKKKKYEQRYQNKHLRT